MSYSASWCFDCRGNDYSKVSNFCPCRLNNLLLIQTLLCRFGETCVDLSLPVLLTVACSQAIHRVGVLIAYNEAESAATAATSKDIVLFLKEILQFTLVYRTVAKNTYAIKTL